MMFENIFVWWLLPLECEALQLETTKRSWPDYITRQLASLEGRSPRGRLWADSEEFGTAEHEIDEQRFTDSRFGELVSRCGGILIWAWDYPHVKDALGFVTTGDLQQLNLAPHCLQNDKG